MTPEPSPRITLFWSGMSKNWRKKGSSMKGLRRLCLTTVLLLMVTTAGLAIFATSVKALLRPCSPTSSWEMGSVEPRATAFSARSEAMLCITQSKLLEITNPITIPIKMPAVRSTERFLPFILFPFWVSMIIADHQQPDQLQNRHSCSRHIGQGGGIKHFAGAVDLFALDHAAAGQLRQGALGGIELHR